VNTNCLLNRYKNSKKKREEVNINEAAQQYTMLIENPGVVLHANTSLTFQSPS